MNLYDPECAVLAEHFLEDKKLTDKAYRAAVDGLSEAIQDAVEEWLYDQAWREREAEKNRKD